MAEEFIPPDLTPPYRLLVLGGATQGWYDATDAERTGIALPRLISVCRSWEGMGARLITSLDDDVFTVGESRTAAHSWYLIYEIDRFETAVAMIDSFRKSEGAARLDRWFRLEARICRPFFPVEG